MTIRGYPWEQSLRFGDRLIDPSAPCYVIAEIGGNFNGDYELAVRSIDAAVDCGVDAVKFQTYRAEDFIADPDLTYTYQEADGQTVTVSQLEMFKKMELPYDWHRPLMDHAVSRGVQFLSSAADVESAKLLAALSVPAMKIASEDLINIPVVEHIAASGIPTLLSTGMASEAEISNALEIFAAHRHFKVMLLHCTSRYPTPPNACNLNRIGVLRSHYNVPVGFSDHTEGCFAPVLAVAHGARVIEKHFTLDRSLPGPDHRMSTDPQGFRELVEQIRLTEMCMGSSRIGYDPSEEQARTEFRRSIVAGVPITAGTLLSLDMLAYRRPGGGLKPYEKDKLLGKKLLKTKKVNDKILLEDVE